jgi:transcriptional activator HAC1
MAYSMLSPESTSSSSASSPGPMSPAESIDIKHIEPTETLNDNGITTTVGSGSLKRKEELKLPLPVGALPPRKRAKTQDEKEQRRIERIMRNRQAAHASREKKRKHVEELEKRCVCLSNENSQLYQQVREAKRAQLEMVEQQCSLIEKLKEYQEMVEKARQSGDITKLPDIPTLVPPSPPVSLPSTPEFNAVDNVRIKSEDDDYEVTSPSSAPLYLSSFTPVNTIIPSKTKKVNSLIITDDSSSNRTHHPAVVV